MATKKSEELTLKDRLSRLNFTQACKLLGPQGAKLIRHGGARGLPLEQVLLGDDLFSLRLPEGPVVTITLRADAKHRLCWNCTACTVACEHAGAVFSLILEEKMALGLSAPRSPSKPVESMSEDELIAADWPNALGAPEPRRCACAP